MSRTGTIALGLEEEFFLIEAGSLLPTLQSLDYLRRLFWKDPGFYRQRLASNFARGDDRKLCWMSSVEVSTRVSSTPENLIEDLIDWRRKIAEVSRGALCAPVGAPLGLDAPSNTAGTHLHFGVSSADRDRVFANLAYFLPVFAVASMNSPCYRVNSQAKSYRMACNFASGDLREDREYRFQDIIVSKRLGTVEIRALDPIPDAERLLAILRACVAVAQYPETMPFDRERYNKERPSWSEQGLTTWVRGLWEEMQAIATLPLELLESTESDVLARLAEQDSPEAAYRRLDSLWRKGTGVDLELAPHSRLRSFTGVLGYYVPQLPWMAFKGFKEWYGHTPDATRSLNGKLK